MPGSGGSQLDQDLTRSVGFAPADRAQGIAVTAPEAVLALVPLFLHGWRALSAAAGEPAVRCRARSGELAIPKSAPARKAALLRPSGGTDFSRPRVSGFA